MADKIEKEEAVMKPLYFEGTGFEYFRIWIVNVLLVIITLGIYYPWARVGNLEVLTDSV